MANLRRELVRYGSTTPANGIFDGELFVLVVEGSDNVLYMWNANDEAWEPVAGDAADVVANDLTLAGDAAITGTLDVTGTSTLGTISASTLSVSGAITGAIYIGSTNGPNLQRARVPVAPSEITFLHSTPKTLIGGVTGRVSIPLYMGISKWATTAHNDASAAGNLIIETASGTKIGDSIEAAGFVDDTTSETAIWINTTALVIPWADAGDLLRLANDGSAFVDGGSANTQFMVELLYITVDPSNPGV